MRFVRSSGSLKPTTTDGDRPLNEQSVPTASGSSNANSDDEQTSDSAPHPGSHQMPRWEIGPLGTPPTLGWKQIPMLLGPGLVMGASAIGGGEWLTGPLNT